MLKLFRKEVFNKLEILKNFVKPILWGALAAFLVTYFWAFKTHWWHYFFLAGFFLVGYLITRFLARNK